MRLMVDDGGVRKPISKMSYPQTKQAAAIADCIGRLIPHEGVDYDIEVVFKSQYSPSVSMNILPHTDKGEWWKSYVMSMIGKYPPTVDNPPMAIDEKEEVNDEEVVS